MALEITGTIETILPIETGAKKDGSGDWQKQQFIVTNNDGFEGKKQIFCFEVFGDQKVENLNKYNKEGQNVTVEFNISTNEHKGKYYTSLPAWKITTN